MSAEDEHVTERVTSAAARTVAERTSRLFAAWSTGSPIPGDADRRCEGVADLATRRARVWQETFFTAELTAQLVQHHEDAGREMGQFGEPQEMVYDGANCYLHVGDSWTGFFLGDPAGPRRESDPLWPLDALFGAKVAVEMGADVVRGVAVTRYRVTIDLARADAALPSGVTVPSAPYRFLSQIPAEVWLDAAGRARRISVNSDPGEAGEAIWSIAELWEFGAAADIAPPDPADVLSPRDAYGACEVPTTTKASDGG